MSVPVAASPTAAEPPREVPNTKDPRRREFRPDIEGLRAVAVLGVLIYHAAPGWLPGGFAGVDVFFVISGFLITGLIQAEIDRTGRLSISRFYARRIKRLLPTASFVLVVTAVASTVILSSVAQLRAGHDIRAAALYVLNWRLAAQGTDYLSASVPPGPVQHYWSLCVEEQYYLLWPFLLLGAALLARRARLATRPVLLGVLGLTGVVSFLWCVRTTEVNQPYAFFGTASRVWELALGGVLAVAAPWCGRLLTRTARRWIGWTGLLVIAGTYVVLDEQTPFPGTVVLFPVVATVLVLAAALPSTAEGRPAHRPPAATATGASVLLGRRPFTATGRISYSLYLWHWPFIVLGAAWLGEELSPWQGLALVGLSVIPSYFTWRFLEEPFRRSRALSVVPTRAFALAAICTSLALLASALPLTRGTDDRIEVVRADGSVAQISTVDARADLPSPSLRGCNFSYTFTTLKHCTYGASSARVKVALIGDSHALQWFEAVDLLRRQNGWYLDVMVKNGCNVADTRIYNPSLKRGYKECDTWRPQLLDELTSPRTKPDVVFMSGSNFAWTYEDGTVRHEAESEPLLTAGLTRTLQLLTEAGIQVYYLRDIRVSPRDPLVCMDEHAEDLDRCAFDAATAKPTSRYEDAAVAAVPGVRMIDTADLACPGRRCSLVSPGGVATFRDAQHLSASYVSELAPAFVRLVGLGRDGEPR